MSKNLNPLDASWLLVESRDTPMHVGGLLRFSLPDDLPADFFRQLITEFRAARSFAPPAMVVVVAAMVSFAAL